VRDAVSNREFLVKVRGKKAQDEMRVAMKPGAVANGESYTVRVEAIEKPRYVP
jgi:hypothetical protein